jgi:hypothetical protein
MPITWKSSDSYERFCYESTKVNKVVLPLKMLIHLKWLIAQGNR